MIFCLHVALQAVETPLPPNWTEFQDEGGKIVYRNEGTGESSDFHPSDAYFLDLINTERAKGHAATWGGAWLEFHDQNGLPYYYDFQEDKTSSTRPATLRIAPPNVPMMLQGAAKVGDHANSL